MWCVPCAIEEDENAVHHDAQTIIAGTAMCDYHGIGTVNEMRSLVAQMHIQHQMHDHAESVLVEPDGGPGHIHLPPGMTAHTDN